MNEEPLTPQPNHLQFEPLPPPPKKPRFAKKFWIPVFVVLVAGSAALAWWLVPRQATQVAQTSTSTPVTKQSKTEIATLSSGDLKLDPTKNYGDKYANGIVPVGDGKYVTSGPQKGSIYTCRATQAGGGGA